jgi:hypothetical protein
MLSDYTAEQNQAIRAKVNEQIVVLYSDLTQIDHSVKFSMELDTIDAEGEEITT